MKTFVITLTILSVCFYGCETASENSHEGHEHTAVQPAPRHEIIFTKAQASKTDFEVQTLTPGIFRRVIKTTGQILPAPGDEAVIVAKGNGIISYTDQTLASGKAVKPGQPLFSVSSRDLEEGDYYSRVRANYEKTKAEYDRASQLVKDKIISQKEFESARLDFQNAQITYDAVSGKQSARGVGIPAPIGGYVKNITVKDGEYVTAGQPLATISQNKRLLLRADVPEKHYSVLHTIGGANFKTPYDNRVYELEQLSGKLLSAGKSAEANTFFIPVTFEFDNRGAIVPGSFVEVYLLSFPMTDVLSIPLTALTNEMGHFYVYKQLDAEGYQKQEIKIGASNGKAVEVLEGLTAGERVVTKGAYQVKMASASAAIPGHTHEH